MESTNTQGQGNEKTTYLHLADGEGGGKFEVDLVTFREKGQQIKFLSINFINEKGEVTAKTFDQESFGVIKAFFNQLDWNI